MRAGARVAAAASGLLALFAAGCGGSSPARPTGVAALTSTTTTTTVPPSPVTSTSTTTSQPPLPTLGATRFLAFGDSLTLGQSATLTSRPLLLAVVTSYPDLLERDLRAAYVTQDVRVLNSGRGGEWAVDGVERFRAELPAAQPDAVLLLEGANDLVSLGERGMQPALDALDYMIQLVVGRRAPVFVATLPPQRPGGARAQSAALVPAFNESLRRIASRRGAVLVDLEAAFGMDDSLLSADGLHPTAAGYQVMARSFLTAIRATLERRTATPAQIAGPLPGS
jgi:lysophospholipase L1-like esterase